MRGQNALERLRLAGYKPRIVWLTAVSGDCSTSTFLDAENALELGEKPEIHVASSDVAGTLDFRPLTGVTVLLSGREKDRLREIFQRLKIFDPQRVIVSDGTLFFDTENP